MNKAEDLTERLYDAIDSISSARREIIIAEKDILSLKGKTAFPYETVNDQMKVDMLLEMWDSITVDDIEALVKTKKNYVHGKMMYNKIK